jgi:hypothetical protein
MADDEYNTEIPRCAIRAAQEVRSVDESFIHEKALLLLNKATDELQRMLDEFHAR